MDEGLNPPCLGLDRQGTQADIYVREQIKIFLWLASHCLAKSFLTLSGYKGFADGFKSMGSQLLVRLEISVSQQPLISTTHEHLSVFPKCSPK